jgi:hypothetical protein
MVDENLRREIHDELELRVKSRYYGHISPDEEEREIKVVKLYLVLAGYGCPGCEMALEAYKKEIDRGDIEVIDVENDEKATSIVSALGLFALPALVAEDAEGDYLVVDGGL